MKTLQSFVGGRWTDGNGAKATLVNPATEEPLAEIAAAGPKVSWREALAFSRERGGAALRALTFAERGVLLKNASKLLHAHRDELIALAIANGGNTRSDAKFDIDGASGTLAAYGELGAQLGKTRVLVDGDGVQLTRSVRFFGQHIAVPRAGVAVHVNAFNFPAWNMMEKAAVALLAGMPVVTKPATATALVAHRIVELFLEHRVLPDGALSLVAGGVGDLLAHLSGQDVLAFTGSSDTGAALRRHDNVVASSVRVNVEADSLNAAVLGPDAERGGEAYSQFVADVVRDMTQKTGQKCTAIRRVLVPKSALEGVREDLIERLSMIKVGDPALEEVTMGPVATARQLADVRAGIARLRAEADSAFGGDGSGFSAAPIGVEKGKGFFVAPVLLALKSEDGGREVHAHEVFGPVATLIPYGGSANEAVELVARGGGGLVSSIYSDDRAFLGEMIGGLAPFHGRLFLGSSKLSGHAVGPGTVLPQMIHGGPGRAGGGEELGGARGLSFYLQRTAVTGDKPILEALFRAPEENN
ncbi:MAG TPA: 3,4-dehydroadipyl-CoA semialdehyde dehydrogenase [Polyangia bacterium]